MTEALRIYRFTNIKGDLYHGIVIRDTGEGWDLLMDSTAHEGARIVFVSNKPNPYRHVTGMKTDLLPVGTSVRWNDKLLARAHTVLKQGNFDAWFEENLAKIYDLLNREE